MVTVAGLVFRYHSQDFQAGVEGEAFLSQFLFRVEVAAMGDHPLPSNQILLVHLRLVTDKHLRLEPEIQRLRQKAEVEVVVRHHRPNHPLVNHHRIDPLLEVVRGVDPSMTPVEMTMTIQSLLFLFRPSQEEAERRNHQILEVQQCQKIQN
ncbi:MAG: hypothetical protein CMJ17_09970 [Phenylobacterium sp.]|nr:hypothetical protein [Phenylobacterium sp.]